MNCINANTELFVVLKKSDYLPFYDESITKKGYDNVAYIEMLRRSCWSFLSIVNNSYEIWTFGR